MRRITIAQARWAVPLTALALWPAWVRQAKFGLTNFPIGLVMFVLLCGWWVGEQRHLSGGDSGSPGFLIAAWGGLIVYAGSYGSLPPLGSQVLATLTLACVLLAALPPDRSRGRVAYLALLPLTLPVEMALQFVIGFPFRRVSAEAAGMLLSAYGVTVKGTTLIYQTHPLEVDTACSGVLGLWAFMIAGALLSLVLRHRWPRLLLTLSVAGVAGIAYNIVRTSLLFMYRFHQGVESHPMHTAIGAVAFLITIALFVAATVHWLGAPGRLRKEVSTA